MTASRREPLCTIEELRGICLFPSGIQELPVQDCDEVYPGIFIGNEMSASNLEFLRRYNIGYVLNAAHGLDSSLNMIEPLLEKDYALNGIKFLGIPAIDIMSYPINQHFEQSIEFIREGLQSGKNVLVHCKQGISRSAALVLAYLMVDRGMQLQEATRTVRRRREILPNDGFLMQLCNLNEIINACI
ncbi:dual specificity protein phosphatase 3 [Nephila pilipes]|uniref:protein-serine/threonine phosphatase n=1 Tax=Nephila pilipes TaxID=299642 RepID=A0A8X6SYX8_NEPPI|nr:dual specificity protein phosphatase 3 [Nephila pilipes]